MQGVHRKSVTAPERQPRGATAHGQLPVQHREKSGQAQTHTRRHTDTQTLRHTLKMSYPLIKKEFAELIFTEKIELYVINHIIDIHYTLMQTGQESNVN